MEAVDGVMLRPQMGATIAVMREAGHTEDFVEELSPDARIRYVVDDVEAKGDNGEEEDEGVVVGDKVHRGEAKGTLKPWLDPHELTRALEGWNPREVAELEAAGLIWTPRVVCKLLRAFKKAKMAWEFLC